MGLAGPQIGKAIRVAVIDLDVLKDDYPEYKDKIAVGLAGQGSECFGYDDVVSRDHDYAPGFCLWVPEFIEKKIGDELQKAYDELPVNEFLEKHKAEIGMEPGSSLMTGARKHRVGVHSIEEFYTERTGIAGFPEKTEDWIETPMMYLAEAVNGKVFTDPLGKFTAIREAWAGFYPDSLIKKKVAANCGMAGKTGQFNYERSIKRGDIQAAHDCCEEFIHKASAAIFLLNRTYMPYYKWRARAMEDFKICKEAVKLLSKLTQLNESKHEKKTELIEKISMDIIKELTSRTWSWGYSDYLLDHAKNIMTIIPDREIASWNVFVGED